MENLIKVNSNNTITSMELVEIINEFRKLENENYKELKHDNFIKKIRKEIDTLENIGVCTDGNFSVSEYTDTTGRKLPCYHLNRNGMLQMLNSESAFVRYKTIEYIDKLETDIKNILTTQKPTYIEEIEVVKAEMGLIEQISSMLHINDNSKLILMKNSLDNHGVNTNILPEYTQSKGVLKSATDLLKEHNVDMSTQKFNKTLIEKGILQECERKSTKDNTKIKKFKNLVDTTWGENQISKHNSKETQPLYYVDKFAELLKYIGVA